MNLTKPQKLIYDMEKFAGGAISVICGNMLCSGKRNESELASAVNTLYRINDALRIRISETDGMPEQNVTPYQEKEIEVLHFEEKAELDFYAEKYATEPVNMFDDLCEIKVVVLPKQFGILVKLHHLVGDAWSLSLLGNQFNAILNGETPEAYSYVDYITAENDYLQSNRYSKDKAFFLEQFSKCDEVTYLSEKQNKTYTAKRKTFVIGKEKTIEIVRYAESHETTAFALFSAALSTYLNRTKMNAEKFYIGTAVLNRTTAKEKKTVGMFINTVPMLMELDNGNTFAENLTAIQDSAFSVFRHQKYNYGDVLSALRTEHNFGEKLYDVIISFQNATVEGNIESTWYHCGEQTESLQIHIEDRDHDGIFRVHFDYLIEKFTEHEIDKLFEHITNLLYSGIQNDNKKLYELNILSDNEKLKMIYNFNNTVIDYPMDMCVHELFEEQVKKVPDKVALFACDKSLTYFDLNIEANRIAHSLIKKGVGVGDIVAFALPRKSHIIATMLGILKTGAAYLPIDPDYPQDRIDYILNDSNSKFFITKDNITDLFEIDKNTNPMVSISNNYLCYCIYTSGSTGNPKGVLLSHRNVVNYISNNEKNVVHSVINNTEYNIVSVTTCGFDIFVTESLLPLANGMGIILANENQAKIQSELNTLLKEFKADVLQTTPSKMKSLISDNSQLDYLKELKVILLGGESLDEILVRQLRNITEAKIFNIYGPTETTVWSTNNEILSTYSSIDVTIGHPIANTQIYIVDKFMQPMPIGVTGEICIAGDGVGAGYLNRPELTAEKFIDNPFGDGKLYKTGDLAYWREDGNIAYVGRNDFQVKIRGLRIELGEIESAISAVDGIEQSVVVVRKNNESRQLICAFYTGKETDAKEIKTKIGKKLPKYMLPHIFKHLDMLPLTVSGKINRKALPEVDLYHIDSDAEYVAPTNELQKALCKLAEDVLGISHVGITDDFFDIGGDSLKSIEYVSKAHKEGIYFSTQNVFEYPTVQELCKCIENGDNRKISFADVDFSTINQLLAKNTVERITVPQKTDVGNLLLAGATGYLGIHILADFLCNDKGTAYCIVRGKDDADSETRLRELLSFYFGDKFADSNRIKVFCGDLSQEKFGLSENDYEFLSKQTNTVVNCAASVKHYGSYKYFYEINVESTKRLIAFCQESGATLIHTSTLSVSGNSFADDFDGGISSEEKHFYESTLYIGQPLGNVYARSKFEAEKAVLDAMAGGLQANIMRMGNLTNRYSDGMFQKNYESNAFLNRLKSLLKLGIVPDYLMNIYAEFTPIDDAANAVMTIARHFSAEQTVFHINSTKIVYLDKLLEYFNALGFELKTVSGKEFTDTLRQTAKQPDMEHILETFINDMDENDKLNYESNIHIENGFTVKYLKNLGFEWKDIDIEYLRKYVAYFKKIGCLGGTASEE